MLKFFINLFTRKPKYKYVFEEDAAYGGWMVYIEGWPHATAVGKTKQAAIKSLLEDLETIKSLKTTPKISNVSSYSDKREIANAS